MQIHSKLVQQTAEVVTAVELMPDLLIPIPFTHSVLSTFLLLTRKGRREIHKTV